MSAPRLLTPAEAGLIEEATERWLRLRDVELNAAEPAAHLLARAALRSPGCSRRDIASLGRSILLEIPGEPEPLCITLVRPGEDDPRAGRVSILSGLGLACIGRAVCSTFATPHGMATFIGFADTHPLFGEPSRQAGFKHEERRST